MLLLDVSALRVASLEGLHTALRRLRPPVRTVEAFLEREVEEMVRAVQTSHEHVITARTSAAVRCLGTSMRSAVEEQIVHKTCSTGSTVMDTIVGRGGFACGEVSEVRGAEAGGKTQLCLLAAAVAALSGLRVLWIDAGKCSFDVRRLHNVLQFRSNMLCTARAEEATAAAMRRISWTFVEDIPAVVAAVDEAADIVIFDAPVAVAAPNMGGDKNVLGHATLSNLGYALAYHAKLGHVTVLIVNSLVRSDNVRVAALGFSWSYVASLRIMLRCAGGSSCSSTQHPHPVRHAALLEKHPSRPLPSSCLGDYGSWNYVVASNSTSLKFCDEQRAPA
mmetsp:Transcript_36491/g.116967  ORF Transcript_36491/g.116967 Transcript_36491/m.116967 type:complete len:334 (-) Transcript_36491:281-1282(-)|eukprot:CAMPEP_0118912640 /NCGR_PEP_ID=MMETSP1166-20130328/13789_1 /TAXON_ID=1104430 /ORGANISM="Chrysoreinhardia sp, Strain CCMP3193" /LENGTH=333 /DNA_ID=CAMNT_0006852159 /DNA_START=79 /DNA_END=1080 /DNA_ORIENTATION=+